MRAYYLSILLTLTATAVGHGQTLPSPPGAAADDAPAPAAAGNPSAPVASPPPPIDDWDADVSDFDKLRTADSPAFVVLGVSPTEIQRPSTPRTVIAALGGALSNGSFTIPKDFALEIAPYWLFSHPDLPVQDYRSNNLLRPLRTLSVSVGTTQTTRSEVDTTGTMIPHTDSHIGLGLRTTLFQHGDDDPCTARAKDEAIKLASSATLAEGEKAQLSGFSPGTPAFDAAFQAIVEARVAAYDAAQKTKLEKTAGVHNDKCVALTTSPAGFQVDLAGAVDLGVADAKLTSSATTMAGYALWANASYDTARFSGVAMARLASHDIDMTTQRAFDSGARGIYKGNTYVVSAEALVRYRLGDAPDHTTTKVDIGLEYELTEDTWISVTFGKDFSFKPGDAGSFLSLANLKWGVVKPQTGK